MFSVLAPELPSTERTKKQIAELLIRQLDMMCQNFLTDAYGDYTSLGADGARKDAVVALNRLRNAVVDSGGIVE